MQTTPNPKAHLPQKEMNTPKRISLHTKLSSCIHSSCNDHDAHISSPFSYVIFVCCNFLLLLLPYFIFGVNEYVGECVCDEIPRNLQIKMPDGK